MPEQLDVFVCYRQVDGRGAASWLRRNLHGAWVRMPIDGGGNGNGIQDVQLNVYFDQTAPAVSDWKASHLVALESAKAFVLVCTPGSYARLPDKDFVAREIQWWIEHRQQPPLLVDASGEGVRWTPPEVTRRWPDAQRIILLADQWRTLPPSELQEIETNTRQRLLEGIAQSGQAVIPQELTLQRRRNVTLSRLLKASVILLLLVLGLAAGATRPGNGSPRTSGTRRRPTEMNKPIACAPVIDSPRRRGRRPTPRSVITRGWRPWSRCGACVER